MLQLQPLWIWKVSCPPGRLHLDHAQVTYSATITTSIMFWQEQMMDVSVLQSRSWELGAGGLRLVLVSDCPASPYRALPLGSGGVGLVGWWWPQGRVLNVVRTVGYPWGTTSLRSSHSTPNKTGPENIGLKHSWFLRQLQSSRNYVNSVPTQLLNGKSRAGSRTHSKAGSRANYKSWF